MNARTYAGRFPPPGFAVRVDGRGWRAYQDKGAWYGPWRSCYRDALEDAAAQSQPLSSYAERRAGAE